MSRDALGVDDVVALLPFGDHLEHDFGRVLQIGVHDDDRAAGGVIEPGRDRDLMAEIARQLDEPVALVGARLGLDHDRARILDPSSTKITSAGASSASSRASSR